MAPMVTPAMSEASNPADRRTSDTVPPFALPCAGRLYAHGGWPRQLNVAPRARVSLRDVIDSENHAEADVSAFYWDEIHERAACVGAVRHEEDEPSVRGPSP
jgi:hypothetical protein